MLIIKAIVVGIIGYVFVNVLMEEGMVFSWYSDFIDKLRYEKRVICDLIYKPIGGCSTCFTGQLALWYYLITYWGNYDIWHHIAFISIAILTEQVLLTKLKYAE